VVEENIQDGLNKTYNILTSRLTLQNIRLQHHVAKEVSLVYRAITIWDDTAPKTNFIKKFIKNYKIKQLF